MTRLILWRLAAPAMILAAVASGCSRSRSTDWAEAPASDPSAKRFVAARTVDISGGAYAKLEAVCEYKEYAPDIDEGGDKGDLIGYGYAYTLEAEFFDRNGRPLPLDPEAFKTAQVATLPADTLMAVGKTVMVLEKATNKFLYEASSVTEDTPQAAAGAPAPNAYNIDVLNRIRVPLADKRVVQIELKTESPGFQRIIKACQTEGDRSNAAARFHPAASTTPSS